MAIQQQPAQAGGSLADVSLLMKEQQLLMTEQQMLLLERDDKAKQEMEAKLAEQKQEMEAKMEAKLGEMAPREAVSGQQIEALTARLEAVHGAKLLSDDELFAVEDCVADFIEAQASYDVVTMEAVNANCAIGKVHKLVALGEGMPRDAMFARQLRRKFVGHDL